MSRKKRIFASRKKNIHYEEDTFFTGDHAAVDGMQR